MSEVWGGVHCAGGGRLDGSCLSFPLRQIAITEVFHWGGVRQQGGWLSHKSAETEGAPPHLAISVSPSQTWSVFLQHVWSGSFKLTVVHQRSAKGSFQNKFSVKVGILSQPAWPPIKVAQRDLWISSAIFVDILSIFTHISLKNPRYLEKSCTKKED